MKKILSILFYTFFVAKLNAQIAVVTPSGSTSICPTIDSAINKANPNDIIYLPAGNFNGFSVTKKVTIIGVGHHPDSSSATGRTLVSGNIIFSTGSNVSNIDGLYVTGNIIFNNSNVDSISINRVNMENLLIEMNVTTKYLTIKYSILRNAIYMNALCCSGGSISLLNSIFSNNVIKKFDISNGYAVTTVLSNCTFKNNIFLGSTISYTINNLFANNIFINWNTVGFGNNLWQNNLISAANGTSGADSVNGINNIYGQTSALTFINQNGQDFNYSHNYHLKPSSPGVAAGTDGTDIGIYGGAQPWKDGNIPPNPHIYFKNVAPQTAADGKLLIQYKVRANN